MKKLTTRSGAGGFTLMELLIVAMLMLLIGAFLFGTFNFLLSDYSSMFEEARSSQYIFNALEQISSDLKMAKLTSIMPLWPSSGNSGALSFQADLNNDGVTENYIYYLYHQDDAALDGTYLGAPSNEKFYRLYRFQGTMAEILANYAGHPGILLAEDVVPPITYDGSVGSYFQKVGEVVRVRIRLSKEKQSLIKENIPGETSIYVRNI